MTIAPTSTKGVPGGLRPVRLRSSGVSLHELDGGTLLVRPEEELRPYPKVLTDRLTHWARLAPHRVCIAKRENGGDWRRLAYAQVFDAVQRISQALLGHNLSAERPIVILSENDIEHYLLMLAGQHVGIPTSHISPIYSLVSKDFARLRHALQLLTPGLIFVSDAQVYRRTIETVVPADAQLIATSGELESRQITPFAELLATKPTADVDRAHERIDPDSPAKILFTSGSTAAPKGVVNTHRNLCSNQQQIAQIFGFLEDEPPILVDWLPWNHTFGGNHNIGIALYNGGTFYLDGGKPARGAMEETVRNLREISPTVFFNVPKGYEGLLPYLRAESGLRETFFRNMRMLFYAAAGLSQPVWDAYRTLAEETCGERIIMVTGLGATETAPMAIQTTWETDHAGIIGVPIPGVEAKLVPRDGKLEARVRGPNITPGYWRQPELTQKAFDEDGFYKFGDAVRFVDRNDVNKGFFFDGRFSEDFKLASGTWVSVGPLRARFLAHFAPFVRDVVVAGHDRDEVTALIFADADACASLHAKLSPELPIAQIAAHPAVRERFLSLLEAFAAQATGSSNRLTRAILLEEPPSLDAGEITDKGSLNQRAVLERRAALVGELYGESVSPRVLRIRESE